MILITGVTGFIGQRLMDQVPLTIERSVRGSVRKTSIESKRNIQSIEIGDINAATDWSAALNEVSVVIHAAGLAHSTYSFASLVEVNVEGTLNLARQAASLNVKRFIFFSSANVIFVDSASLDKNIDILKRSDYTGKSKWLAEEGLKKIAQETGMEVVIIRPPLVYGAGVKANFLNLMKLAKIDLPLPFGAIHNARSMVYLDNLVDFVIHCIDHPVAANRTFLISDGQDISLTELLTLLRKSMGKAPRLLPIPMSWFHLAGKLTGKHAVIERLCGSLQVDASDAFDALDWQPPYTLEQGIQATVDAFLKS